MKGLFAAVFALGAAGLFAAPPAKTDPVAEGFAVWQGITPKSYVLGREITPSDLRHRITVVIEVEAGDKLQQQFQKAGEVAAMSPLAANSFGENWETRVLPRNEIYLVSVRGGGKDLEETVKAALKPPKDADQTVSRLFTALKSPSVPVYSDVALEGAPDAGGKYPFVYILPPTGAKPVYSGALDAKSVKEIKGVIGKERKKLAEFKFEPFFGTVEAEKRPAALVKALEKGKTAKTSPLTSVAKALQRDIVSKDAEKASTAQIVCDALEQTRGDLVMRIKMEARECPHRAFYDIQQLVKYWPGEKKRIDDVAAKLKANPEAAKLAQIFCKLMVWADPNFVCKNASEANKIVKELSTKVKKDLEKMKESKVIVVQNGAQILDAQVDELISTLPMRVPQK